MLTLYKSVNNLQRTSLSMKKGEKISVNDGFYVRKIVCDRITSTESGQLLRTISI